MFTRRSFLAGTLAAVTLAWVLPFSGFAAPAAVPANLGHGLGEIVEWHRSAGLGAMTESTDRTAAILAHLREVHPRAQSDATGRVIVEFILDGRASPAKVKADLTALGVEVFAEAAATGGSGAAFGRLSARLPLERAIEAARVTGVHSILLAHRPRRRVGRTTTQGLGVLKADTVLARGFTGRGIKVGAISDSYNLRQPSASADIASDDLPGPGNPAGRTNPVTVLQEADPADKFNADEGRALLQIVHDVAPDADLAFAASGPTPTTFANAIRSLRTDPNGRCDIICEDISFSTEPFFSDGVVSQAVDDVINRTDLPGRPVLFYTAGGNDGGFGYDAEFTPISDADARNGTGRGNLKLSSVPAVLTAGGFHNFAAADGGSGAVIGQSLTVSGADTTLNLQWDDPFIPGKISADYNLLVFDSTGTYLAAVSGVDDNVSTAEAVELVSLATGANGRAKTYQIAISRRLTSSSNPARRLRYIASTDGTVSGPYLNDRAPTLYGHVGARGVDAVGAYGWDFPSMPESFSGLGPITILFDASGNRLANPEVRVQPTISATDGVNTTFFPQGNYDSDQPPDGFPNFFGTSAAAPHVAGVAATLLQAAGGPGSISSSRMREIFTSTATRYSADPEIASNGYSRAAGFGLLNAQAALNLALHPPFFQGEVSLSNGVYYLQFPSSNGGNIFGYYTYAFFPYLYHFDLGFLYFVDAQDSARGAFFYDFTSSSWFYSSPSFPFPYLYDFGLNALLYYYPDSGNPGSYTKNPRYFFNFRTGQVITR